MEPTDTTHSSVQAGDEGSLAHEKLEAAIIRKVSTLRKVPLGAAYITIQDILPPLAVPLMMLEYAVLRRYTPEGYIRTYITGGSLWLTFGRRMKWNPLRRNAEYTLGQILRWLHAEGLRYVVVQSSGSDHVVVKAIDSFNRSLEQSTHAEIIRQRSVIRDT